MADIGALSSDQMQFIERMGRYFERYQLPRIGGRLLGLLTLVDGALGLDDLATALGVSRASISTNARQLVAFGLAEHVTLPGDRRDFYRYAENPWLHAIEERMAGMRLMGAIAAEGLAALPPGDPAGARLAEMRDACDFFVEDLAGALARWRARQATSADHRPRENESRLIADT